MFYKCIILRRVYNLHAHLVSPNVTRSDTEIGLRFEDIPTNTILVFYVQFPVNEITFAQDRNRSPRDLVIMDASSNYS